MALPNFQAPMRWSNFDLWDFSKSNRTYLQLDINTAARNETESIVSKNGRISSWHVFLSKSTTGCSICCSVSWGKASRHLPGNGMKFLRVTSLPVSSAVTRWTYLVSERADDGLFKGALLTLWIWRKMAISRQCMILVTSYFWLVTKVSM